jgi:PAS domain-containing protein
VGKKFVDPIVHLTAAVQGNYVQKPLGQRRPTPRPTTGQPALPTQRAIDIQAPDEVGALARAFNAMIARLARQEADLISANASMAAGLARSSAILDNIPDLAWVKDIDGRFIAANQVLLRAWGSLTPTRSSARRISTSTRGRLQRAIGARIENDRNGRAPAV